MRRFLRQTAAAFAALMLVAAGLAVLVDPYDYWGAPRVPGLSAARPAANTHLAWVKERQLARGRPWRAIVVGNSRVQVGFDPASPAWAAGDRPVYNLGLAATTARGQADAAVAAIRAHRPTTVYLAADMTDFFVGRDQWRAWRPRPERRPPGFGERLERANEVALSRTALADALLALAEQRSADPVDISPAGYPSMAVYHRRLAEVGHAGMFAQRGRENFRRFLSVPRAVRWPGPGGSDAWAALDRVHAAARAAGTRLVVFTYPFHADNLRSLARAGHTGALLDFQRALAEWGAARGVPVYDFTRVNAVTAEPVPPGKRGAMRWYWEGGHFKAALGDRIIAVMRGRADPVGGPLTPANIAAANARLAAALAAPPDAATARRLDRYEAGLR